MTLSNLLAYFLYLFSISKVVARKLRESIRARFLWEDMELEKRYPLANWEAMSMKQLKGREEVWELKSLSHFNEALLGKRLSRFNFDLDQLCRRVVVEESRGSTLT